MFFNKYFAPKENSKRQEKLRAEAKPINYVECNKCRNTQTTLRKTLNKDGNKTYICENCLNKRGN